MPFIDDIGVKGPISNYNDEVVVGSTVRRWLWEHVVNLERILFRLEDAELTVSGAKLVTVTPALSIVGSVVSKDGMKVSRRALNKVKEWETVFIVWRMYGLFSGLSTLYEHSYLTLELWMRRCAN